MCARESVALSQVTKKHFFAEYVDVDMDDAEVAELYNEVEDVELSMLHRSAGVVESREARQLMILRHLLDLYTQVKARRLPTLALEIAVRCTQHSRLDTFPALRAVRGMIGGRGLAKHRMSAEDEELDRVFRTSGVITVPGMTFEPFKPAGNHEDWEGCSGPELRAREKWNRATKDLQIVEGVYMAKKLEMAYVSTAGRDNLLGSIRRLRERYRAAEHASREAEQAASVYMAR